MEKPRISVLADSSTESLTDSQQQPSGTSMSKASEESSPQPSSQPQHCVAPVDARWHRGKLPWPASAQMQIYKQT